MSFQETGNRTYIGTTKQKNVQDEMDVLENLAAGEKCANAGESQQSRLRHTVE